MYKIRGNKLPINLSYCITIVHAIYHLKARFVKYNNERSARKVKKTKWMYFYINFQQASLNIYKYSTNF